MTKLPQVNAEKVEADIKKVPGFILVSRNTKMLSSLALNLMIAWETVLLKPQITRSHSANQMIASPDAGTQYKSLTKASQFFAEIE